MKAEDLFRPLDELYHELLESDVGLDRFNEIHKVIEERKRLLDKLRQ